MAIPKILSAWVERIGYNSSMKLNFVILEDLRGNIEEYIVLLKKACNFSVLKKSCPVFKITPPVNDELWEEAIDFTKIKKGGVDIDELLRRL